MKKIFLATFSLLILFSSFSAFANDDYYLIKNGLKYHKAIKQQQKPQPFFKVSFGTEANSVGGSEQDKNSISDGVPFAFRMTESEIWLLDSVNKFLKCFSKKGKLLHKISLKDYGKVITDFSFGPKKTFWLLAPTEGMVFQIDKKGKKISSLSGFTSAARIQAADNSIYISNPFMQTVYKFSPGKDKAYELTKHMECTNRISLFENEAKSLYEFGEDEKTATLYARERLTKSSRQKLISIPYTGPREGNNCKFVRQKILGLDAKKRLYFRLTVNDNYGVIYLDRFYRYNPRTKNITHIEALSKPSFPLTPSLPRETIVSPDGKVIVFYASEKFYYLGSYKFPNS